MGRIQSSVGLVTGVAIEDTVNQLISLNAIPRDRLASRNEQLQREQVAITELTALVVGVQLTSDRLGQKSLFSATVVNSSNGSALSASSTGSPKAGNYSFVPVRQAQTQQLTSSLYSSSEQQLGAGEVVIHTGGFLDEFADLDSLNGGSGVARGFISITDRSGGTASIDLRFAQTAEDVVSAINGADNLKVVASIEGDRFQLTDVSGASAANLSVAEVGGGTTAADLGLQGISVAASSATGTSIQSLSTTTGLSTLLDGRGLDFPSSGNALEFQLQDGTTVSLSTSLQSNTASLGQLIDEINAAGAGSLSARIASDGKSIEVEDLTSGGSTFAASSPSGTLAAQLGLDNASSGGVIQGDRLIAGLNDVLLSSLGGGAGLGTLGQVTLTDRSGESDTVDLSSAVTLQDVIETINASAAGVTAQLNSSKTGIEIRDTTGETGGSLTIADADGNNAATKLGIAGSVAADFIDSKSLNRQFVTRNTELSDFNQGSGVQLGSIQFTDTAGATSSLNLATLAPKTLGEVVDAINGLTASIEARINDAGDGLVIVDQAGGSGSLSVVDNGNGLSAQQLGIAGTGTSQTVGGSTETAIDGSQTIRITTTATSTVASLAEEINALTDGPVSANILNLNASGGVRLLLNSSATGQKGRVAIDSDVGIAFSETSAGRDALLAFGANESTGGVLVSSSTNTFTGLVEDIEFNITGVSDTPVTVTVTENDEGISNQIETFVDQFNKLRSKYDELTVFDEATQSVGILFGKSSTLRVEFAYGRLLSGRINGAGSIKSLGQLGVRLNESGKLQFDKSKFDAAYAADSAAVEEFFTTADTGFSARAKSVADSLAAVDTGVLLNRSTTLSSQIEQNNDRLESFEIRLERQRTRLLTQFYNMETTIARLQQNLSALNGLQSLPPLTSSSSS